MCLEGKGLRLSGLQVWTGSCSQSEVGDAFNICGGAVSGSGGSGERRRPVAGQKKSTGLSQLIRSRREYYGAAKREILQIITRVPRVLRLTRMYF
ncbi:hypothetical protein M440DRAFT_1401808 [Trichoderma longibrachiatum ATCC 18648]|uniref:Uncharacterized protein n=1 Tax=Trichoderma longibrachiatum ATCC 18648 TaxID=983965 RepID=A0A2T4C466_TRILO|nr:hypothetical protein M440DRAFT_1401808 [Trichoderma longibrachiatum ATCC 18648]